MNTDEKTTLKINDLIPFRDNPFILKKDMELQLLIDSIKENGVIEPILVTPDENGKYEIISGHRRVEACIRLGIEEIPAVIKPMSRDEAIITLVNCNIQRETLLPSEKAYAYKMKLDAMKHQGRKMQDTSLQTCGQVGHKSRDGISEEDSGRMVQRYIRLTNLTEGLLKLVDEKRIALSNAVELSYLDEDEQLDLLETIESEDCTPSYAQAIRLRKLSEIGACNMDAIFDILTEEKANQREYVRIPMERISRHFKPGASPAAIAETMIKALEHYVKELSETRENKDKRRNTRDER